MSVLEITKNNFEEEVVNSDKVVLIDFWASWCGPCKMLAPVVDEFAKENSQVKVCKVDVTAEGDLASQFNVMSIPTLIVFKDGKPVGASVGVKSKAQIAKMVNV